MYFLSDKMVEQKKNQNFKGTPTLLQKAFQTNRKKRLEKDRNAGTPRRAQAWGRRGPGSPRDGLKAPDWLAESSLERPRLACKRKKRGELRWV